MSSRGRRASATCICRRAIRDCSQEPWRCPHSVFPWDRGGTPAPERRPTLTTRYLPIAPDRALPSMARQVGGTGTGNGAWRLCRCGLSCRMFLLSRRVCGRMRGIDVSVCGRPSRTLRVGRTWRYAVRRLTMSLMVSADGPPIHGVRLATRVGGGRRRAFRQAGARRSDVTWQ